MKQLDEHDSTTPPQAVTRTNVPQQPNSEQVSLKSSECNELTLDLDVRDDTSANVNNNCNNDHVDSKPQSLSRSNRSSFSVTSSNILDTVTVQPMNDFIHLLTDYLCPTKCGWADKLTLFILSTKFAIVIAVTSLIAILLWFLATEIESFSRKNVGFDLYIIGEVFWFVEALLIILSFDHIVFKEQIKSFDSCFRICNTMLYCVCDVWLYDDQVLAQKIFVFAVGIASIVFLTCIDAFSVKKRTRGVILGSLTFFIFCYYFLFYFTTRNDTTFQLFGRDLSLKTIALGTLSNLTIFMCKQLFGFIKDPTKATNVMDRPKLIVITPRS